MHRLRARGRDQLPAERARHDRPARQPAHAVRDGSALRRVAWRGLRRVVGARRNEGLAAPRGVLARPAGRTTRRAWRVHPGRSRPRRDKLQAARSIASSHRDIRDMHAALDEIGILYITLMVHEGWGQPGPTDAHRSPTSTPVGERAHPRLPVIERQAAPTAGTPSPSSATPREGFIIQNSWGPGWGAGGFALLPYEDYLLHATDVWVAQLGVPVESTCGGGATRHDRRHQRRGAGHSARARSARTSWTSATTASCPTSGDYWTTEADIARLFARHPDARRRLGEASASCSTCMAA